jgi:hypothetical protein
METWHALPERQRAHSLKIENFILLLHGRRMEKTSCAKVLPQSLWFSPGVASFTWGRFFHRWRLDVLDLRWWSHVNKAQFLTTCWFTGNSHSPRATIGFGQTNTYTRSLLEPKPLPPRNECRCWSAPAATIGVSHFLHGEAILLAPLFPRSPFSHSPFSEKVYNPYWQLHGHVQSWAYKELIYIKRQGRQRVPPQQQTELQPAIRQCYVHCRVCLIWWVTAHSDHENLRK